MGTIYRNFLGFNLNAAPIGGTDDVYPLQYLLSDSEGDPAWYTKLRADDLFVFYLVDISDLARGTSDSAITDLAIELLFADPSTGAEAWPFSVAKGDVAWQLSWMGAQPNTVFGSNGQAYSSYSIYAAQKSDAGEGISLSLVPGTYRMSGSFTCTHGGVVKRFIFDPELIVGDADDGKP